MHGVRPLFHYSEGGANNNPRAHTDFPISTPAEYMRKHVIGIDKYHVDWDIELKQKDYAINHLYDLDEKFARRQSE